jgi:hypothetical protein
LSAINNRFTVHPEVFLVFEVYVSVRFAFHVPLDPVGTQIEFVHIYLYVERVVLNERDGIVDNGCVATAVLVNALADVKHLIVEGGIQRLLFFCERDSGGIALIDAREALHVADIRPFVSLPLLIIVLPDICLIFVTRVIRPIILTGVIVCVFGFIVAVQK